MAIKSSSFNVYHTALLLLCLANLLELFVPRMDEGNYFARLPIQAINGLLLLLMWTALLYNRNHWNKLTRSVYLFIPLIMVYAAIFMLYQEARISDFSAYLKFLLWTTSIIFFYEMMLKYGVNDKLLRVYIVTFLIAVSKKILEGNLFNSEKLGGGDTAALPLLFIIPIVLLCFSEKYRLLVFGFVSVAVLFSLRRTVILGMLLCMPFIYKYISARLRAHHLLLIGIGFVALIFFTWGYVGEAIFFRFSNLLTGDAGGDKDTYGSGRSEFYLIVWNSWMNGDYFTLFFGKGLNSVYEVLMRTYGIGHVHNDILEIGHTFGLLGLGIWAMFLKRYWSLRKQIRLYCPESSNLFYISFLSYGIIALASGCVLRITTLPFALTIAMLLYQVQLGKVLREQALPEAQALVPEEQEAAGALETENV